MVKPVHLVRGTGSGGTIRSNAWLIFTFNFDQRMELTLHCSSPVARFWDFPRGSAEQLVAKQHWDSSRKDVFLSMEDVLKYLVENT